MGDLKAVLRQKSGVSEMQRPTVESPPSPEVQETTITTDDSSPLTLCPPTMEELMVSRKVSNRLFQNTKLVLCLGTIHFTSSILNILNLLICVVFS